MTKTKFIEALKSADLTVTELSHIAAVVITLLDIKLNSVTEDLHKLVIDKLTCPQTENPVK